MSCQGCATGTDGKAKGCKSNGGCSSGGCNRLNTYDWLSKMDIYDPSTFEFVEVSFKNGSRKAFFKNEPHTRAITGDTVVVESQNGHDIGRVSLSGELVRLQMKKKRTDEKGVSYNIIRRANERDMERLQDARSSEQEMMVRARVITRTLGLEMKVGDVEYQGDKRKATFYYVADGRIDFRELIRHFAKEFKVKIEMRQIGARQESARIGGIGSCGRELCCSTWLTDFKSVSTTAARYQNLAINQSKLSGQCGRLKCCLNYELDTYMDALEDFPKGVDALHTEAGKAVLVKTDIFKRIMYFAYEKDGFRGQFYPLDVERVKEIAAMNKAGEKPLDLQMLQILEHTTPEDEMDFDADLTGVIELPPEVRKRKRRKPRGGKDRPSKGGRSSDSNKESSDKPSARGSRGNSEEKRSSSSRRNRKPADARKDASKDTTTPKSGREERRAQRSEDPTAKDANAKPSRSRDRRRANNKDTDKARPSNQKTSWDDKPTDKAKPSNKKAGWDNKPTDKAKPSNQKTSWDDKPTDKAKPSNKKSGWDNKPTDKAKPSNKKSGWDDKPADKARSSNKKSGWDDKPADKARSSNKKSGWDDKPADKARSSNKKSGWDNKPTDKTKPSNKKSGWDDKPTDKSQGNKSSDKPAENKPTSRSDRRNNRNKRNNNNSDNNNDNNKS